MERTTLPDLIVSDYYLPSGKTGIEAIEGLRKACSVQIPGFIVSGDTSPEPLPRSPRQWLLSAPQAGRPDSAARHAQPGAEVVGNFQPNSLTAITASVRFVTFSALRTAVIGWVMRHDAIVKTARLIHQRIDLLGQQKTKIDLGHPEVLGVGRDGLPAVLDSFSHFPHINTRLVHISRVVGRHRQGD
jgi:CheY-like chemotaxis protein